MAKVNDNKKKNAILTTSSSNTGDDNKIEDLRTVENIYMTEYVINDWKFILDQFIANKNLSTAGAVEFCENPSHVHNFWWARASFMRQTEEPLQTRRHYYENWLGM